MNSTCREILMNVSGVVVKTAPEKIDEVVNDLEASGLCEVHFHDNLGKIIVTVEGESIGEEIEKMKGIINMPGVLCANLVYSCSEKETDGALEHLMNLSDAVPEALKDDKTPPRGRRRNR